MDRSSYSPKTRTKPDIYSTFVVHDDDDGGGETNRHRKAGTAEPQDDDPYSTMVFKDNGHDGDDDDEDSSLPPLLKRLPKDFGGGASLDYYDDDDDEGSGDFGTVIVKTDRRNRSSSPAGSAWKAQSSSLASPLNRFRGGDDNDGDGGDDGGEFSTFVVRSTVRSGERESVSGTVVRRTSGGGGGGGSTMERAVASMQAMGDMGFGKQRKGSGSSQNEEGRQPITTKVSTSSIPESVTREDPTTKYELLNELGRYRYQRAIRVLSFFSF